MLNSKQMIQLRYLRSLVLISQLDELSREEERVDRIFCLKKRKLRMLLIGTICQTDLQLDYRLRMKQDEYIWASCKRRKNTKKYKYVQTLLLFLLKWACNELPPKVIHLLVIQMLLEKVTAENRIRISFEQATKNVIKPHFFCWCCEVGFTLFPSQHLLYLVQYRSFNITGDKLEVEWRLRERERYCVGRWSLRRLS